MGGPDMAPHTPRPAPRSSWGLDRVSEPDTAGGSSRPGGAVALLGIPRAPAGLLGDGLELGIEPDRCVRLRDFEAEHRVGVDVSVLFQSPLALDDVGLLRGLHGVA